jgi:hypothetical protein
MAACGQLLLRRNSRQSCRSRPHSIILSALITSDCGILRPSALPVLRLMRNSNFVLLGGQRGRFNTLKNFVDQRLGCRVPRFADQRDSSSKNSTSIGERSKRWLACSISSGVHGRWCASHATARRNASPLGGMGGTVIAILRLGGHYARLRQGQQTIVSLPKRAGDGQVLVGKCPSPMRQQQD